MHDVRIVKKQIKGINKSMLEIGLDRHFISKFWIELLNEIENETKA